MLFQTPDLGAIYGFLAALAVGALIGIEREKRKHASQDSAPGGLRTFILLALLGAVAQALGEQLALPWLLPAAVLASAGLVTAGYLLEGHKRPQALGMTTEIAALLSCLLGALAVSGHIGLAVALAIVVSSVLAFKEPIHGLVARLGMPDILAALKLLIASFIVLPLLPNHPVDPWLVLNPWKLWLLVILISGLSLVGYVATRWLGETQGRAIAGLTGGLVSSTAVSLSFARQSRDSGGAEDSALAAGILISWCVMFLRVALLAALARPTLLSLLLPSVLLMLMACTVLALRYYLTGLRSRAEPARGESATVKNPFSLVQASKFALIFAGVLLGVELMRRYAPGAGMLLVAALAGLTDVDAITLSMSDLAADPAQASLAVQAIVVATLANTATKCGLVVGLGSPGLRRRMLVASSVVMLIGGLGLFLV